MLEKGEGDHGHKRVSMQTAPGTAFEVIEAEFLLELLMGLLADPARLDGGRQRLQGRVGRQVGEIVFVLACRRALADEPDFLAWQVLLAVVDALRGAVRDADPHRGEARP